MKTVIVVCLAVLAVATAKYTDKYDGINVKEIVENCRLMVPYIKCCLGETKKCTKEGLELKSHIVDALQNKCAECTEVQKTQSEFVLKVLINRHPKAWNLLRNKYDSEDKYVTEYKEDLEKAKASGEYNEYPECDLDTERAVE